MKKRIRANGSSSGSDLLALLLRLTMGPMLIATLLLAASYRPEPKP